MTFGNVVRVDKISAVSFDDETLTEFAKDRWNADHIVGARRGARGVNGFRWIDFREVPERFRHLVKQWCQILLAKFVTEHCGKKVQRVKCFLTWFVEQYPEASTLHNLTTGSIDTYLGYLRSTSDAQGNRRSEPLFWKYVQALRSFLEYLELTDHPYSPLQPVSRLVDYQRIGKPPSRRYDRKQRPKYIPESVLKQLDQYIEHLSPTQIPVVIVLRASGWRISDVLNLRLNTCLEHDTQGWSLCGDISKTGWLGHRIPLSEEVAVVIEAQQTWVRQNYTEEENPSGYLFPYIKNKGNTQRRGQNRHASSVNDALQRLAKRYHIVGENGEVFHFHTHAFRHSKAVELINNGMSLVMVQNWMAHASPEMTLLYAQILDDTMRKQWQQTVERGAVRMAEGKPEFVLGKKLLNVLNDNALDVERVREHRTAVKLPIGNCVKSKKFLCRFIELPCFHCAAYVLTPADLPALEAYADELRQRTQIGQRAGNLHWVEANQQLLEQKVLPSIELLQQGQTIAKTEKYEREYTNEEWEQRGEEEL